MNMVKRIMGRPRQEECSPQDNALGLMHLRRLFTELCHPPRHMTQKEQEEKLYMMLPVFNRVSPASGAAAQESVCCKPDVEHTSAVRVPGRQKMAGCQPAPQRESHGSEAFNFLSISIVRGAEAGRVWRAMTFHFRVWPADLVLFSPDVESG